MTWRCVGNGASQAVNHAKRMYNALALAAFIMFSQGVIDLFLADINLVLVSADLEFGLLVHFLLRGDEFIHLLAHFFNLLSLSVIYVGLAGYLIMAFPDLVLSVLILTAQLLI